MVSLLTKPLSTLGFLLNVFAVTDQLDIMAFLYRVGYATKYSKSKNLGNHNRFDEAIPTKGSLTSLSRWHVFSCHGVKKSKKSHGGEILEVAVNRCICLKTEQTVSLDEDNAIWMKIPEKASNNYCYFCQTERKKKNSSTTFFP